MERLLEYVVAGNTAQMNDPAFVVELKAWIRFSAAEAERTGDGLFSGATGSPVLPRWLGSRLMSQRPDLVVRFGRGPAMPLSMRRPVQAVLI